MRSDLGMWDKRKWNKMPFLSIMKLMLFVSKIAADTSNVSAHEQKIQGKELTRAINFGYGSKEFDSELKRTLGLQQIWCPLK